MNITMRATGKLRFKRRREDGRGDVVVIAIVAIAITASVVFAVLHIFQQSEEHAQKVRETKVAYSDYHGWKPERKQIDTLIKNAFEKDPNRESFSYPDLEFSEEGAKYFAKMRHLKELIIQESTMQDDWLKYVEDLPLRNLRLDGTEITNRGFDHIGKIETLAILNVADTEIDDVALMKLRGLKNLQELSVRSTDVTGLGMKHLQALENLKILSVKYTKVNEEGLKEIAKLPHVYNLDLGGIRLRPESFQLLRPMKELSRLHVTECGLNDEAVNEISKLKLAAVYISSNPMVTDRGLMYLSRLPQLEVLAIDGCKHITISGIDAIRKALPKCEVRTEVTPRAVQAPQMP